MLFDAYLFADYSGARSASLQRKSIRLAAADATTEPAVIESRMTREELVGELARRLRAATDKGLRVCFGQDHQYGIPIGLSRELKLDGVPWRETLERLARGTYGEEAPQLGHASVFASALNAWLIKSGGREYFYSATKGEQYGIPRQDPRRGSDDVYRITERRAAVSGAGSPKSFNRVGDTGTVGGQTLVGLLAIRQLLQECERRGVHVAAWPFDGLAITDRAYQSAHVLVEPYPTAVRGRTVAQSDDSDAIASAAAIRDADLSGALPAYFDLSALTNDQAAVVRTEGWIVSHSPTRRR